MKCTENHCVWGIKELWCKDVWKVNCRTRILKYQDNAMMGVGRVSMRQGISWSVWGNNQKFGISSGLKGWYTRWRGKMIWRSQWVPKRIIRKPYGFTSHNTSVQISTLLCLIYLLICFILLKNKCQSPSSRLKHANSTGMASSSYLLKHLLQCLTHMYRLFIYPPNFSHRDWDSVWET